MRINLQALRNARGLTQAEVAEELGVAREGVTQLESCRNPHIGTVESYLAVLGLKLEVTFIIEPSKKLPTRKRKRTVKT